MTASFASRVGPRGPSAQPVWLVYGVGHDHVRFSLVAADPRVLAGCIGYLQDEARPVVESQHGSLGLALLEEPGV